MDITKLEQKVKIAYTDKVIFNLTTEEIDYLKDLTGVVPNCNHCASSLMPMLTKAYKVMFEQPVAPKRERKKRKEV